MNSDDASKLLRLLEEAFKGVDLPFKVKPIEKVHLYCVDSYPSYNSYTKSPFIWRMLLLTECGDDEIHYLRDFFRVDNIVHNPTIDFEEMQAIRGYFVNEQDAFNFQESLNFKTKTTYYLSADIELTDDYVTYFLNAFNIKTEPLRERRFNQEFDKEVEDHLSKYNSDDGHK